jgi:hypothetical protein
LAPAIGAAFTAINNTVLFIICSYCFSHLLITRILIMLCTSRRLRC